MKKKILVAIIILLAIFCAYWLGGRGRYPRPLPMTPQFRAPVSQMQPLMKEEVLPAPRAGKVEEKAEEGSISERLVIKRGNLSLLVKETLKAVEEAKKIAENLGGFVLSSHTWYTDAQKERVQGEVVIKVPSDKFSEAIGELKDLAIKVVSEQTTGQDVTEEYVDLESRLKNLEATEEQFRAIMKRSGKISEILEVQRELTRVRNQIEVAKGRMKYLKESAAMATITVNIATEEEELPIVEEKWRLMKVVKAALRALVRFWQKISGAVIWFGVFFSPFILLGLLIWLIRKIRR